MFFTRLKGFMLCTCLALIPFHATAAVTNGLIAHYPFNGNANDESGHGYVGAVHGASLTTDRFGNPNAAYQLDGANDYIDIGNSLGTDATAFTVSLWVWSEGIPDAGKEIYIGKKTDGLWRPGQWMLWSDNDSEVDFVFNDYSGNNLSPRINRVAYDVHDGTWHHLCGTMSSAGSRFYIDGECVSSNDVSALVAQHNSTIYLGARNTSTLSYYASGRIDDVYIYDRALSEEEVEELYMDGGVVLSAPIIHDEPLCTLGRTNLISWIEQDGPIEYWVEAMAVQQYAPGALIGRDSTPPGWDVQSRFNQKHDDGIKNSGWISSTSYLFEGLTLNTIYMYRVKASIVTDDGRLEGAWSEWVTSCQVPVLP